MFSKITKYSRIFGYRQLLLFRLNDLLQDWIVRPSMRHARALRLLAYAVPPDEMTIVDDDFCFTHSVNSVPFKFALRRRSSDADVFVLVIKNSEYADVARLLAGVRAPRIIDAGANVGLTTLYFKAFSPDALIIAIEPEAANFARLSRCVKDNHLQDVTLLNKGMWVKEAELAPDWSAFSGESWAFALREARPEDRERIPVVSLQTILAGAGWSTVDVLKIDIEGSEAALIRDRGFLTTIQTRVKLLCIEVHETHIKRAEVSSALTELGFTCIQGGETLMAMNNAFRPVDTTVQARPL